jgi:hypothetical protein
MTHRQECIAHCQEHLTNRGIPEVFSQCAFDHIYRKNDGANKNAFLIALRAADHMIFTYQPAPECVTETHFFH